MTLLTVVRDVCAVVGVNAPTTVFGSINSNRTMFEMVANANEMAQRIAYDLREWSMLKKTATFTGDDLTTAFDLPLDYKRMLLKSEVWLSTSSQQPMRFIPDFDEWLRRRSFEDVGAWGEWTIYGGQMHIFPVMPGPIAAVPGISAAVPAVRARFSYLGKNCVALDAGGSGDRFVSDADTFLLDERVLKLGMIFNWKQLHGSPYGEDMGSYSDALAMAMGPDNPAPILMSRQHASAWSSDAYF